MLKTIKWWLAFLAPAAVDGEGAPVDGAEGAADAGGDGAADAGDGSDVADLDLGADDAGDQGDGQQDEEKPGRANQAIRDARKRAQDAEERANRFQAELDATRRGPPGQSALSDEDRLFQEEDAKLRAKDTSELERWQIQSNRSIRDTNRRSAQSAFASQDLNDKTNFTLECSGNKRLAAVKDKVEAELTRLRQSGTNAPRQAIAHLILGKMVAEAKPKKAAPEKPAVVDRGRPTGARSDVRGRANGIGSNKEKLQSRLRDVPI